MPQLSSYDYRTLSKLAGVTSGGLVGLTDYSGRASIVDFGGVGDGVTINDDAWAAIFADTTVVDIYVPEGTFLYGNDQVNNIVPNHVRRIWGPGKLQFGGTVGSFVPALYFNTFTGNIVVEGLTFENQDDVGACPIIWMGGNCSNIEIRRNRFVKGYWIVLANTFSAYTYTNFRFIENLVEDFTQGCIGFAGPGLASSVGSRVIGNHITGLDNGFHCIGFDSLDAAGTHEDCEIRGNTITTLGTSSGFAITLCNTTSGGYIADNVIKCYFDGIHLDAYNGGLSADFMISGNKVESTIEGAIFALTAEANSEVRNGIICNNFVVSAKIGISIYGQGANNTLKNIAILSNRIQDVGIPAGTNGTGILIGNISGTAAITYCTIQNNSIHQTDATAAVMSTGIQEFGTGVNHNAVIGNTIFNASTAITLLGAQSTQSGNVTSI